MTGTTTALRHEALFYDGDDGFVEHTGAFVREGLSLDEVILIVVAAAKADLLRDKLGEDARLVRFADMAEVGRNPARIIPAWSAFRAEQVEAGRGFRGVGEPIWVGRAADELVECERHEALLNLAFVDGPVWKLACPYDVSALAPEVVREAERNHPVVVEDGVGRGSPAFARPDPSVPFDLPLPEPPGPAPVLIFGRDSLDQVREEVRREAVAAGLDAVRTADLVLAASEVASNSVRHGGGRGTVRVWRADDAVRCEIRDAGVIADPLAGRMIPTSEQTSGFGLWLVNQLCDLVQVRTSPGGSIVRMHMHLAR
ncbi:MAG: sensor histidine kinase [Actinomycetota bacterium]